MKNIASLLATFMFICSFTSTATAGLLYTYEKLTLMELDEMNKLVEEKLKESKKSSDGRAVPLKEAFQAVLSRPDQDRMIEKVSLPLRFELENLEEYQKVVTELTDEALNALKHTKNFKPSVQVTYAIFLENLMADIKNLAAQSDGFERELIRKIKKADISITKQAQNDRSVRGFKEGKSPSETAEALLESFERAEKEAKSASEKAEKEAKSASDKAKKEAQEK